MNAPTSTLPEKPGPYWWRAKAGDEWEIVDVRDFSSVKRKPILVAYHMGELWGGRTISRWVGDGFVVGQWAEIEKPGV